MNAERLERRSFSLPSRCHYLLQREGDKRQDHLAVIALHGYGMTPEQMLRLTAPLVGEDRLIASLQGPHQLWTKADDHARSEVAFHWATRFEAEDARRMHHEIILRVIRELNTPASRTVLVGFSQSVSLNYRFACTHPGAVGGVIAICGGIPDDWESGNYQGAGIPALHITTREDRYYPPAAVADYPKRLQRGFPDVEFHMLEGGHRIPSAARPIVRAWLARIFG